MPLFSRKKPSNAPVASKKKQETKNVQALLQHSVQSMPATKPIYHTIDSARKEIRLLVVLAGNERDPIRCQSQHTFLGSKAQIPYETISYCWGANPGRAIIELDRMPVVITGSAAEVIRRVRYPNRERVIWIDAVCINQDDMDEKTAQVAFMGEIYRRTVQNVIWLGGDGGSASKVRQSMDAVLSNMRAATNNGKRLFEVTRDMPKYPALSYGGNQLDLRTNVMPLLAIFSAPWFGRLWIVQEAALPPRSIAYFGPEKFQLLDILRVALWLTYNLGRLPDQLRQSDGLYKAGNLFDLVDRESIPLQHIREKTANLSILWTTCMGMNCKDPRDKIYALLGLHDNRGLAPIVPDYRLPHDVVFRDVTRQMIEESGSLSVLGFRQWTTKEVMPLAPSWAVNFGADPRGLPQPFGDSFAAANGMKTRMPTRISSKDGNVLRLVGRAVDTVTCRSKCIGDLLSENAWPVLKDIDRVISLNRLAVSDDRLAATLMGGESSFQQRLIALSLEQPSVSLDYIRMNRRNPPRSGYFDNGKYDKDMAKASWFFPAIARASSRRRFFVTKCGRIGLGPQFLKDGDLITALYGSRVPLALRYVGGGRYSLVGACYVDSLMAGEALRGKDAQKQKDVEFCLI